MAVDDRGLSRIAGAFFVAALLLLLGGAVALIASGALSAFSDLLHGSPGAIAPYLTPYTVGGYLFAAAWAALLLGSVAFTRLALRSGDELIAPMALAAVATATVLGLLQAAFTDGVTPWAARQAAGGSVPVIYTVLHGWMGQTEQIYIVLVLMAQAGFSLTLLRARLIPAPIAWITLAWALAWLPLQALGIPALLFVWPGVIGAALLVAYRRQGAYPTQEGRVTADLATDGRSEAARGRSS